MPIDLPNGKTFADLMLDFAVRTHKADQTEDGDALPADEGEQRIIRRWVNDGYRLFIDSDPQWTFLRGRATVALSSEPNPAHVEGENWRYRLPPWVDGPPIEDWTFIDLTVPYRTLQPCSPHELERRARATNAAGVPNLYAVRPATFGDPIGGQEPGWELLVYPRPVGTFTVRAECRVNPPPLREPHQRTVAGAHHDRAIVDAAYWLWARHDKESPADREAARLDWETSLARSKQIDEARRPATLGVMGGEPPRPSRREDSAPVFSHGIQIT